MRFESLQVERFGRLVGFEVKSLGDLVVLFGANESGKSTVFQVFVSLLFGFLPANLKFHPYAPWNGGHMEISGDLHLDRGDEAKVSRRMATDIRGWYQTTEDGWEVGNAILPFLGRISREVYSEVYALGARDLEFFREQTWHEVQGGLIPGLALDFFIPVEQVLSDIDKEMNSLWRPTRHKKTKARIIQEDLSRLRADRKAIEDGERTYRERRTRLQEIGEEKEILANRKVAVKALLRKADRLAPVHHALSAMEESLRRAGAVQEIEDLPENPREFMESAGEHIRRLEERREALIDKMRKHSERTDGFTLGMESVLEKEQVIEALGEEIPLWSSENREIEAIRREMLVLETRIGQVAKNVTNEEVDPMIFLTLPRADLLEAARTFEEADSRLRAEEERLRGREDQAALSRRPMPVPSVVALLASLVFAILGVFSGRLWMVLTGALCGTIAGGSLVAWYRLREDYRRASAALRAQRLDHQASKEERDKRHGWVQGLLKQVPISERRLENPNAPLFQDLMEIRESAEALQNLRSKIECLEGSRRQREARVERLAREMEVPFDTHEVAAREIVNMLFRARDAARQREESREALDEINLEMAQLDGEIKQSRGAVKVLINRLVSLGEGSLDLGIENLNWRRDALRRFHLLDEEIQGQPDPEALKAEIEELTASGQMWIIGDEEVERARAELEAIDEDLKGLEIETASITEALSHEKGTTLDDVDSEISVSRLQLEETAVHRDRLFLLRSILSEAERHFKEEHQPDVLRRAGLYLQSMTRGAYHRLSMGEARGKPQIMVHPRNDLPVPAANPLSRGTLDQIYLALKLSLVDHLDEGRESLPMFLDEALVNWGDGERLGESLSLLHEVSAHRQVFLFTCHGWLPERLKKLNAQVICLS